MVTHMVQKVTLLAYMFSLHLFISITKQIQLGAVTVQRVLQLTVPSFPTDLQMFCLWCLKQTWSVCLKKPTDPCWHPFLQIARMQAMQRKPATLPGQHCWGTVEHPVKPHYLHSVLTHRLTHRLNLCLCQNVYFNYEQKLSFCKIPEL